MSQVAVQCAYEMTLFWFMVLQDLILYESIKPVVHYDEGQTRKHETSAGIMLAQRRRRWANIIPALDRQLLLTGKLRLI